MTYSKQHLCNLFFLLTIIGCGGGDDEGSKSEPEAAAVTEVVPIEEQTTDDLVSNTTFEFTSGFDLIVTLMPFEGGGVQHFVNVCSDFELVDEEYVINYDSCKIRTAFTIDKQVFDVSLSSAETELIAQVWPVENDAIPLNYFWQRVEGDEDSDWIISIDN